MILPNHNTINTTQHHNTHHHITTSSHDQNLCRVQSAARGDGRTTYFQVEVIALFILQTNKAQRSRRLRHCTALPITIKSLPKPILLLCRRPLLTVHASPHHNQKVSPRCIGWFRITSDHISTSQPMGSHVPAALASPVAGAAAAAAGASVPAAGAAGATQSQVTPNHMNERVSFPDPTKEQLNMQ